MSRLCGLDVSFLVGKTVPFTQIVYLGYDDGPTSGAARCPASPETYRFELLTRDYDGTYDWEAWDRGQEIRLFSLAPLPLEAYERLGEILSREELRQKLVEDEAYYDEVASILEQAAPPDLVIATHGLNTRIIAASQVTVNDMANTQDWFAFLGLAAGT